MKVLIACEESQRVCAAFRAKGHEAYSCDILPCSGGHPEWHIQHDAIPLLNGRCCFETQDGAIHRVTDKWDLIIAHPPCTYLTAAGAANIPKHPERIAKGFEAADFLKTFLSADCEKIVVENPPPMKRFNLPKYTQLVRPYMFGEVNNKPICLWIKGVEPLTPTKIVEKDTDMVRWVHKATGAKKSCSRWYNANTNRHSEHRSKTFEGVAKAMAEQWG